MKSRPAERGESQACVITIDNSSPPPAPPIPSYYCCLHAAPGTSSRASAAPRGPGNYARTLLPLRPAPFLTKSNQLKPQESLLLRVRFCRFCCPLARFTGGPGEGGVGWEGGNGAAPSRIQATSLP